MLKLIANGLGTAVHGTHAWHSTQSGQIGGANRVEEVATDLSLGFIFRSSVLTCRSSLLLQRLLLGCVGEAELDQVLFTVALRKDRSIVELPDNFVTDIASFEPRCKDWVSFLSTSTVGHKEVPCKANTTSVTLTVPENAAGADFVRTEDGTKLLRGD